MAGSDVAPTVLASRHTPNRARHRTGMYTGRTCYRRTRTTAIGQVMAGSCRVFRYQMEARSEDDFKKMPLRSGHQREKAQE